MRWRRRRLIPKAAPAPTRGSGPGNGGDDDRLTGARDGPSAEKPGSGGELDVRKSCAIEDGSADDGRAKDIG